EIDSPIIRNRARRISRLLVSLRFDQSDRGIFRADHDCVSVWPQTVQRGWNRGSLSGLHKHLAVSQYRLARSQRTGIITRKLFISRTRFGLTSCLFECARFQPQRVVANGGEIPNAV